METLTEFLLFAGNIIMTVLSFSVLAFVGLILALLISPNSQHWLDHKISKAEELIAVAEKKEAEQRKNKALPKKGW